MNTKTNIIGKMRGGVRRRGETWSFTLELGAQPRQRCSACDFRQWLGHQRLVACPRCGSELLETRERRQEERGGYPTRAAATQALATAKSEHGKGAHVARDRLTVREYLESRWLPGLAVGDLRRRTVEGYRSHVEHHLASGTFGDVVLQDLTRDQILAHYAKLAEDGRCDGCTKPLSPLTLRHIHATMHVALRAAVEARLLSYNPADGIRLSRGQQNPRPAWDGSQLRAFLQATKDERCWPLWVLFATTGCRLSEIAGLTWDDVDFEQRVVSIRRTRQVCRRAIIEEPPKTRSSQRTIALDEPTLQALERELRIQLQEKELLGDAWVDSGFVFVREDGRALHPTRPSTLFNAAVKRSGLPRITLHGLRHTFATIALNERHAPVGQVSARLGHCSATVTLSIYQHAIPRQDELLAADFANAVVPKG